MTTPVTRRWDVETVLVAWFAASVSVVSFLIYFHRGHVLLYGDAVAHINIARRVFDSRTPGLLQLGTVWLPLPHLLMIPFLLSSWAWRTGVGGSIPSMTAYVFGVVGIFRLVRGTVDQHSLNQSASRIAAWGAAVIYAANPNLIYLQSTAMTEPVYLALFIWAVVYFKEFARDASTAEKSERKTSTLFKCGLCVAAACLTRYDGWFLAVAISGAAILLAVKNKGPALRYSVRNLVFLAAAAPALWLAYNAIIYRNPLEFANGPYSARAIDRKTTRPGESPHPGSHNLAVAATYFLKSAELNLAEGNWQKPWLMTALVGCMLALLFSLRSWPLLLLWVPLPFYILSITYSGVPIFLPLWWPFSLYNVRYGLELLPAAAVFVSLAAYFLMSLAPSQISKAILGTAWAVLVIGSYASVWQAQPVCLREAAINSRARLVLESELARRLKELPPDSSVLMYLGDHVGALQQAGIPLKRLVSEGNHRTWRQPSDSEGLWERALADPPRYVDFVVAMDGDAVAVGAHTQGLLPVAEILVPGQPRATIYRTHPLPR